MDDASGMKFPITRAGDPSSLLALLAADLTDEDLLDIASRDYGCGVEKNLAQLELIVRRHTIPSPLPWHVGEVLGLTRWSEDKFDKAPDARIQTHRKRAFCCAVLLATINDSDYEDLSSNDTLIQLIESIAELRLSADKEAADLLIPWLTQYDPEYSDIEKVFGGLGLLHFALAIPQWSNAELVLLLDWIMAEEAAHSAFGPKEGSQYERVWLLSRTYFDQCHPKWQRLGAELEGRLAPRHSEQVAERVRQIAALLEANPAEPK